MRDLQIKGHRPSKIFGEGCSKEQEKMTTLTKYLEFETWPAVWAALLVSGVQPQQDCNDIPLGAFDLENSFISGDCDQFHLARWILALWNNRENAPSQVRPADFILWCKSQNINTDWLNEVPLSSPQPAPANELVKPAAMGLLRQQEIVIIKWLKENGHNPQSLPERRSGRGTVKTILKAALDGSAPFEKPTAFGKAWDRLRAGDEIKEEVTK